MLSGLRSGTPVFVLYKNEPQLRLTTGKVVSVSNQYPQFNPQQPLSLGQGPVVEMTVEVDGKNETFPRIPLSSSIAEFPDKGIVLSETKDGVLNEIRTLRSASETALSQRDAHTQRIESCNKIELELNPEQGEIAALKSQVTEMSSQIAALTGMLSKSFDKETKK